MKINKLIYAWEQFKEESESAAKIAQKESKPCYMVFIPTLRQFSATLKPKEADEVVDTYGGDCIYSQQTAILPDMVNSFAAWCEQNADRLQQ